MTPQFKEKIAIFGHEVFSPLKYAFSRVVQTKFVQTLLSIILFIPGIIAKKVSFKKRKVIWGMLFMIPLIVGMIYFFMIPFFMTVVYSFSHVENTVDKGFVVKNIGFLNYYYTFKVATFENASFLENLAKSIFSIVVNIPVVLIFALIMAVVLNSKFVGRSFVRAVFFMPVIFNSQAIDIAMTAARDLKGFVDGQTNELFQTMFNFSQFLATSGLPPFLVTFLVTAMTKIQDTINYSGVQILIFLAAIQSVPRHLYEAAQMEGATNYEMFWKITFPMVSPMILPAAVYTIVDSFMNSAILKQIKTFNNTKKSKFIFSGKEIEISNYGINAAMSFIFAISCLIVIGLVVLLVRKFVFYHDSREK